MFGEAWEATRARVRACSAHGGLRAWGLAAFLVKTGDDLRQEQFAMQLVALFDEVLK